MSHFKTPERESSPKKDDDMYATSQPIKQRIVPDYVKRSLEAVRQKRAGDEAKLAKPPRWPMLSGTITFPFYLSTLAPWIYITVGLMVTAWMLMFWLGPGAILGMMSARLLGPPTCALAVLTLGYAASCCLIIVEATSNGLDGIEISPGMDWKEWIWNYGHITVLVMEATLVGLAIRLACLSDSWLLTAAGAFLAFPLVLLGALAADGAWAPLAIWPVLQSLFRLPLTWGLFYVQTVGLTGLWLWLTVAGLRGQAPWLVPIYSAPFLAALILIYARLIGRLAGCIAAKTLTRENQGDDDENR
jgi:hypothetical protein